MSAQTSSAPTPANPTPPTRRFALLRFIYRQPLLCLGLILVGGMTCASLLAPLLTPYAPSTLDLDAILAPPSTAHWLGTVPAVVQGGVGTLVVTGLWIKLFPGLANRDRMVEDKPPAQP